MKDRHFVAAGLFLSGVWYLRQQNKQKYRKELENIEFKKSQANNQDGLISPHMRRLVIQPRQNWEEKVVADGLTFYNLDGLEWVENQKNAADNYWNEEGCIQITQQAEKELIEATFEIHNLCLEVVDRVVNDDVLLTLFEIPQVLWPSIKQSWDEKKTDLLGRMDLAWDGTGPPKLLEYNGDTPSVLVESALAQANWQKERAAAGAQTNFVDKSLKAGFDLIFKKWNQQAPVIRDFDLGIVAVQDDPESWGTAAYIQKAAQGSAINAIVRDIAQLDFVYSENDQNLVTTFGEGDDVAHILKLYPFEWMAYEMQQDDLLAHDLSEVDTIEPSWKLVIGNKALLPLLWEMFPNHPNLLPAYFIHPKIQMDLNTQKDETDESFLSQSDLEIKKWISKPKYGREGHGVLFSDDFSSVDSFVYETEMSLRFDKVEQDMLIGKPIYQQFTQLPKAQSRTILLSSWVIGGMPAGLCFREDTNKLTNNNSEFLPHFFEKDEKTPREFNFKATEWQKGVREHLYDCEFNPSIYDGIATLGTTGHRHHRHGCFCGGGCPSYRSARSYNRSRATKDPMSKEDAAAKRRARSQTVSRGGRKYKNIPNRKPNFGKISRGIGSSPNNVGGRNSGRSSSGSSSRVGRGRGGGS